MKWNRVLTRFCCSRGVTLRFFRVTSLLLSKLTDSLFNTRVINARYWTGTSGETRSSSSTSLSIFFSLLLLVLVLLPLLIILLLFVCPFLYFGLEDLNEFFAGSPFQFWRVWLIPISESFRSEIWFISSRSISIPWQILTEDVEFSANGFKKYPKIGTGNWKFGPVIEFIVVNLDEISI